MKRKFEVEEIKDIKQLIFEGYKTSKICELYKHRNCNKSDISYIRTGKHYKNITRYKDLDQFVN